MKKQDKPLTVGVIIEWFRSDYHAKLITGLETQAEIHKLNFFYCTAKSDKFIPSKSVLCAAGYHLPAEVDNQTDAFHPASFSGCRDYTPWFLQADPEWVLPNWNNRIACSPCPSLTNALAVQMAAWLY